MTFFELLEEIKLRKLNYNEIKKSSKTKMKSIRTLKSISNKVNEKLKEIYHPEFLKKIYNKIQHVYVFDNSSFMNDLGGAYPDEFGIIDKMILNVLHKKNKKINENTIKNKTDLSKRKINNRTISINFNVLNKINSTRLIEVILHELQHLFEADKYNFTEFGNLKRKLFVFINKNVRDKQINTAIFLEEINEILADLNSFFMGLGPGYALWSNIEASLIKLDKKNINKIKIKTFLEKLRQILKESKIYNPTIIDKKITIENIKNLKD